MSYKSKVEMDITDNRYVYNRSRKIYLEQKGKIRCSFCGYHRGENDERKYYGSWLTWLYKREHTRYPNWKLISKNEKQWMRKRNVKIHKKSIIFGEYFDFKIKR